MQYLETLQRVKVTLWTGMRAMHILSDRLSRRKIWLLVGGYFL